MKLFVLLVLGIAATALPVDKGPKKLKKPVLSKADPTESGDTVLRAGDFGKKKVISNVENLSKKLAVDSLGQKIQKLNLKDIKIDFSGITDVVSDKLKKNFEKLAKRGIGKDEAELTGILKKNKILKEIQRAAWKHVHGDSDLPSDQFGQKNGSEMGELLFNRDMLLKEDQLDEVIENAAAEFGIDDNTLTRLGVKLHKRSKRQAIRDDTYIPKDQKWPLPTIYFAFNSEIIPSDQNIVRQAFAYFANQTCLKFNEDSTKAARIQVGVYAPNDNCWAQLGYSSASVHKLNFVDACPNDYGSSAHELMHLFGVHHQQDRSDRETYLINETSIILTTSNSKNYGTPFDYGSVMQYFTGIAKDPLYAATTGNSRGPTFADIALINHHYNCLCASSSVTCQNGGYPNPNGCNKCICPHGFGGINCADRDTSGGGQTIDVTSECQNFVGTLESTTDNPYFKKVWYHFKAPAGKKVQFIVTKLNAVIHQGCSYNGVEMKLFQSKFNRTGYLLCGRNTATFVTSNFASPKAFTSDTPLAMLQLYTRKDKLDVEIKYRYVDSASDTIPDSCRPTIPCRDTDSSCQGWATNGQCSDDQVRAKCAASCNVMQCVCKDTSAASSCTSWKNQGYCSSTSNYYSFMTNNCSFTCGWCGSNGQTLPGPEPEPTCNDIDDTASCEAWAANGDCTAPGEWGKVYMDQYCAKTCNTCVGSGGEACEDINTTEECEGWAAAGDCTAPGEWGKEYMDVYCRKTCDVC